MVTWGLVRYCDGDNAASRRLLSKKHGKDIFEECAALAWPEREENRQDE
jgi:hypothetical protein